jgi:WD40 repeat protein
MSDLAALKVRYEPKPQSVLNAARQLCNARISPCGKFLIGGGFDGVVDRWDMSGAEPAQLPAVTMHSAWVDGLAFVPGGEFVLTGDSWGKVACWPYAEVAPEPRWVVEHAHDGWLRRIALSSDGTRAATCGSDRSVRVWSVADGARLVEFRHDVDVMAVRFHPTENAVVAGDARGRVIAWSLEGGQELRRFDAGKLYAENRLQDVGGIRCVAFRDDGAVLAVGGTVPTTGGNVQGTPTVMLFDWLTGEPRGVRQLGKDSDVYVTDLAFHVDGFVMATVSGNPGTGKLVFLHPDDEQAFFETNSLGNCHSLSLHTDRRWLAVNATNNSSNGNGRNVDKDGKYPGNWSPVHLLTLPDAVAAPMPS